MAADEVDELDLNELQAFLSAGDGAALGSAPSKPAAAEPAAAISLAAALDLPPGLESTPLESTPAQNSNGAAAENGNGVAAEQGRRSGLEGDGQAKVVVEQEDPTAPYLAAKSWDELNLPKEVLDGIFEMGFVKPSKIQEWTLPIAIRGGNIIGQAQNGAGKTAAFALAMLLAADVANSGPQSVCVCPTRELAVQNYQVVERLGKFTGIKLHLAVPQGERARKVDCQIVVGTPGKLKELLTKRILEPRGFRVFVLDEADVMIDEEQGMGPQVLQIRSLLPQDLQILLFSATWPDHVEQFAKSIVPKANHIKVQREDLTLSTITQTFIDVGSDERKKTAVLSDLYGALNVGQSIIFCNTRVGAFNLAKMMKAEGHSVSLICGTQKSGSGPEQIDHAYRDRVMEEFRSGVSKVLISTDVLARGIDVPAVTLVVNYELPMSYQKRGSPEFETYMHRIGRTGRFGLKGVAVNLISAKERPLLDQIKSYYRCSIQQLSGDCEEMEALLKGLR